MSVYRRVFEVLVACWIICSCETSENSKRKTAEDIQNVLDKTKVLGELPFSSASIYKNFTQVDNVITDFKKKAGKNGISVRIQIENYSSLLLGDPIVTLACNQHYQVGRIHDVSPIPPYNKNVFIYNNDHNGAFYGYTTCGILSMQLKGAEDEPFIFSKKETLQKGPRIFIPWKLYWGCTTYKNKFQAYFEDVEISELGNWENPRHNIKRYNVMMNSEEKYLPQTVFSTQEKLYYYRRSSDAEFEVVGIIDKLGCNPVLRVIVYEKEAAFQDLSVFNVTGAPLVRRRFSNIYDRNRANQMKVIGYILLTFGCALAFVGLLKMATKKL